MSTRSRWPRLFDRSPIRVAVTSMTASRTSARVGAYRRAAAGRIQEPSLGSWMGRSYSCGPPSSSLAPVNSSTNQPYLSRTRGTMNGPVRSMFELRRLMLMFLRVRSLPW